MSNSDLFLRLAIALAIGLLVGTERAWQQRDDQDSRAAGLRTFALSGLIGGVAGIIGQSIGAVFTGLAFLGYVAVLLAFQWREAVETRSVGATTAVAGLAVFLLGVLAAVGDEQAAVAAAIATAALLAFRNLLHDFVTRLSWLEIRDGLILLSMAFLLLPVLPDRALDPWGALNLRALWIIATVLAAVSFAGWMAIRALGERWGTLVTAAVGGLASSTATTMTLARLARLPGAEPRLLAAGMCISGIVSLIRIAVLAGVLNPALIRPMALPYAAAVLALGLAALWLQHLGVRQAKSEGFQMKSPLDLVAALQMVVILGTVSLIAGILRAQLGDAGLYIVAALSGLVDLDAITVTVARLGAPSAVATQAILLATGVNLLVKAVLATTLGGAAIGRAFWPATLLAVASAAAVILLVP